MISKLRDPMNGLTHFIGVLLSTVGMIALLTRGDKPFSEWQQFSFSVFGIGMVLLYSFSTLYHWLPLKDKKLQLFRQIDHIMIFVFIAATYTPICLITLNGTWGWSIFWTTWAIAVGGVFLKIFWLNAPRFLYTAIYLLMGWIIIVAIWPLSKAVASEALLWMFGGGVFYSVGAVIYALKKPNPWPKILGFHEIFHLFIMAGTFAHFWMIYNYI